MNCAGAPALAKLGAKELMTALDSTAFPRDDQSNSSLNAVNPVASLLREAGGGPRLLEYRSEADPDAEFIPKTIAGFVFGAMLFGFCINFGDAVYNHFTGRAAHTELVNMMLTRGAFMLGITAVASSLLLVGLKVRADHSPESLFSRHWLNSIGTGSLYATLIWGPWILVEHGVGLHTNPFLASAIFMAILAFPAVSACWTIGRAPHYGHS
jgi:hypothetical protein